MYVLSRVKYHISHVRIYLNLLPRSYWLHPFLFIALITCVKCDSVVVSMGMALLSTSAFVPPCARSLFWLSGLNMLFVIDKTSFLVACHSPSVLEISTSGPRDLSAFRHTFPICFLQSLTCLRSLSAVWKSFFQRIRKTKPFWFLFVMCLWLTSAVCLSSPSCSFCPWIQQPKLHFRVLSIFMEIFSSSSSSALLMLSCT